MGLLLHISIWLDCKTMLDSIWSTHLKFVILNTQPWSFWFWTVFAILNRRREVIIDAIVLLVYDLPMRPQNLVPSSVLKPHKTALLMVWIRHINLMTTHCPRLIRSVILDVQHLNFLFILEIFLQQQYFCPCALNDFPLQFPSTLQNRFFHLFSFEIFNDKHCNALCSCLCRQNCICM